MKRILPLLLTVLFVYLLTGLVQAADDNLVLQNQVLTTGQSVNETARVSIIVGPAYEIQNGASVSLGSQTVTLKPGFKAHAGSTLNIYTGQWEEFNEAPVAVADSVTIAEGGTLNGNVLSNDTDVEGDTLTVYQDSPPSHGTLALNADGTFTYTHDGSETTSDSFTYHASDGEDSNIATVSITITPLNNPPVAIADSFTIDEDSPNNILTVLANDSDNDPGDSLTITSFSAPNQGGTVTNNSTSLSYTPSPNFYGTESFSYTISDNEGATSTATVTVTVNNINDPPFTTNDAYTLNEDSYNNSLSPLTNDIDVDPDDTLAITGITNPDQGGFVSISQDTKSLVYTPVTNFTGQETFNYTVEDSFGLTATATVSITLPNAIDLPTAVADNFETNEDTQKALDVVANDTADYQETLTIIQTTQPDNGGQSNIDTANNTVIYIPAPNYNGIETFSYTIQDSNGNSATATVTVSVASVNDAPVAVVDTFSVGDSIENILDVLQNDQAVDSNDTITITSVSTPDNGGNITINPTSQQLIYSSTTNYEGTETFTYTIADATGLTDTAQVTVTVVNNQYPPEAIDDAITTNEDMAVIIPVLSNDTDIDNDIITIADFTQPTSGTATENGDGTFLYHPDQNYYGFDSFSYTISDGNGGSSTATVSITIMPLSDDVPNDLILPQDTGIDTIVSGASVVYFAKNSITAAEPTPFTVQSGGSLTLAAQTTTLKPGFSVVSGGTLSIKSLPEDNDTPVILSDWPANNELVATQGAPATFLATFGDSGSGVKAVTLWDGDGNNITSLATVTDNTIEYTITNPVDGDYHFTLQIEDHTDNVLTKDINFTVDTTLPVTTPNLAGTLYDDPISVVLTSSEDATIYYSTDGYPPFVGADNTIAVQNTAEIAITKNTHLQFFAVDVAGNIEATKSEVYYIGSIPGEATALEANYNSATNQVELSWVHPTVTVNNFHIYRCSNAFDCDILNKSHEGGYMPPARLRLVELSNTSESYSDTAPTPGAVYSYGITVEDNREVEGVVSNLIPVSIPSTTQAVTKEEAILRALAWLENNQNNQGFWGSKKGIRILATSQILSALNIRGTDNLSSRKALFWLRGQYTGNTDYLSRKILTLSGAGQNVDEAVNKLISQAKITLENDQYALNGWGLQKRYMIDSLDTALGHQAFNIKHGSGFYMTPPASDYLSDESHESLLNNPDLLSQDGYYGWVPTKSTSIYVSSYVYMSLDEPSTSYQWIFNDYKNQDGSFGTGVIDTAAVVLWLTSDEPTKTTAINFLISSQNQNGSWQDNPYITGLCLEALLK